VEPIFAMIVELAEYERAREHVVGSPELLAEALFGARPAAEAVIAEVGEAGESDGAGEPDGAGESHGAGECDRVAAGFALFYRTFSTWECRPGIWLEDLYVAPRYRGSGAGWALLKHLARITVERGYPRLEWAALDWNTTALDFYERAGASLLGDWRIHRLSGDALKQVARTGDS
jgi:GNAT superfamily N-acetyltransferase